jgi:hypothetical protein
MHQNTYRYTLETQCEGLKLEANPLSNIEKDQLLWLARMYPPVLLLFLALNVRAMPKRRPLAKVYELTWLSYYVLGVEKYCPSGKSSAERSSTA